MEKNNNKPKLRFPGFTDPLEQRKLGNIVDLRSGRDYKHLSEGEIPVYGTGGYMLSVNEALSYKEDAIGIGRKGTIDKPYILKAPFWTVDTLFYAVPEANNDLAFIFGIFQNINWKQKDESSGVPSLSKTAINEIDVLIPKYKEQKIIGSFFQNIDNLITLHQRKLNHLQDKKKSLLQKMFPKNGEDFPELRFPEFTDPWEQRKLGEVFNQTTEYVNPQAESIELWSLTVENGLTPKTDRYVRDFLVKKKDKYKAVSPNDIVYNPMNMTLGAIGYNNMSKIVAVSGYYVTMKPTDLIEGYYIKTWMQRSHSINLYKMCATGSLIEKQRVQYPTFAEINFTLPEIEEQKKIGAYFRNIDNFIALHQRKLNHLKEQKKALLQQIFV